MSQYTREGWNALEDWRSFDGAASSGAVEGFGLVMGKIDADDEGIEVHLPFRSNGAYGHLPLSKRPNVLVATFEGHIEAKVLWGDGEGSAWFAAFPKFLEE
jgi:hypothetical protein